MLTRQKSEGAVNQQVTSEWIAWLAGIVDGEGCIRLQERKPPKNRRTIVYSPCVILTNTSLLLKDKIEEMLEWLGLPKYTKSEQGWKKTWKPRWQIIFTGLSRPKKFLQLVRPYLVVKAEEADLLLEFIAMREGKQRVPYPPRVLEIHARLAEIKQTRHLRDCTCEPAEAGKIQSELHGDMQRLQK